MESQVENRFIEIDLNHYVRLFRTKWWFLGLITVIFGLVGFVYSQTAEPIYRASTTLLIDSGFASAQQDLNDLRADEIRAQTFSQLITQRSVLEATIDTLGLRSGVGQLRSQVKVAPIVGTQLIRITVERDNGGTAAIVANTIADTFIFQYSELQSANYRQLQEELLAQLASLDATIQETTNAVLPLQGSRDPDDIAERLQ
jgi:capsular polysaccharide biosynthesis protein